MEALEVLDLFDSCLERRHSKHSSRVSDRNQLVDQVIHSSIVKSNVSISGIHVRMNTGCEKQEMKHKGTRMQARNKHLRSNFNVDGKAVGRGEVH